MVVTLQNHVSLLQSFLSSPTSTTPQQAAEATLHVTLAAAKSTAPKSAITLALSTLATFSKTPCVPAIPYLLSICENDPLEALDVFVLSSAAWKALVAAAIAAPPEPHLAMRIISCAILNAIGMIAKCLQPSTHTSSEVVRTVKIAKFYCLNSARCSRAFSNTVPNFSPHLLCTPLLHLFDFLALLSFVLLFDHHAMLPAHDEIHAEVLPLVTKTLKTILEMTHRVSQDDDREQLIRRALESTGRHQTFTDLRLPTQVLKLLAVLHVTRCALDTKQQLSNSQQSKRTNRTIVTSLLIPFLFDCFDLAYEEIILFREPRSGTAFLDIVTSATADIVSAAQFVTQTTRETPLGLDFLLEQVTSDNAVRSYIAQEALLHIATLQSAHDGWRDFLTATVFACLRTFLNLNSDQANRWQRLAVKLCIVYVQHGKPLTEALAISRRLCNASENEKGGPSTQLLADPILVFLVSQLCDFMSQCDIGSRPQHSNSPAQMSHSVLSRALDVFQLEATKMVTCVQDLALASHGYVAANATPLLPHVLDSKSACGAAISILQRESSNPSMVCGAFNILDPSAMQPATVDAVCTAASSAMRRYGAIVCPAVSAFVSKAAYHLGETVSLGHWQRLSALLESCLITSKDDTRLNPAVSRAVTGAVLHYAAIALSVISSNNREERQTQATLPDNILNEVEDALKCLENWKAGEYGCDVEEERCLVREERSWGEKPLKFDPSDRMKAMYALREARERLLEAASLLLDDSNAVYMSQPVNAELSLLQNSLWSIARCGQSRQ